jgi:hypothetical protein
MIKGYTDSVPNPEEVDAIVEEFKQMIDDGKSLDFDVVINESGLQISHIRKMFVLGRAFLDHSLYQDEIRQYFGADEGSIS